MRLDRKKWAVLKLLAIAPLTDREMVDKTGVYRHTIYIPLMELEEAGLITSVEELEPRVCGGPYRVRMRYYLTEKGKSRIN